MRIASNVTQIVESSISLPENGIAYMITTGKEPLSNMEDFYSRMDTGMSSHGWLTYAHLKILREANFIDLIHNVSISHLMQEDCVSLGALSSRCDHATAIGIFYDVVYGTAPKGSEWRIHSFQVRSKELIFRMVPCFNSSDMIEMHFSLDHLQGQILQFGLEVGYPRWQFWRLGRVVNIVCDMKELPESLRIAVTVSDDKYWLENRQIIYHTYSARPFAEGTERIATADREDCHVHLLERKFL